MSPALIVAPFAILSTWIVLIGLTIGIGALVHRAVAEPYDLDLGTVIGRFWLGLALTILLLQLWHFVAPVGRPAFAVFATVGAIGLALNGRQFATWLGGIPRRRGYAALAGIVVVGWWVGNRALAEVGSFDTGMYHVPMLEWIRAHELVPGLANLHGRFGFNNSSLLLAALLEGGPWVGGSTYLLNGWLALPILALAIGRAATLSRLEQEPRTRACFELLLVPPVIALVADPLLFSGLATDVPAILACFGATTLLYGALVERQAGTRRSFTAVAAVATLAMTATFKLSMAALAGPAVLIGWLALRRRGDRTLAGRAGAWAALIVIGLGVPWLGRGIVLSGYPLYPSDVAPVSVTWRVPEEQTRAELAWVRYFARVHDRPAVYNNGYAEHGSNSAWLRPWVRSLLERSRIWQIALPGALALLFVAVGFARLGRSYLRDPGWLLAPALLVALLFWWSTAPRPVFGVHAAWLSCAVAGAPVLRSWSNRWLLTALVVTSVAVAGLIVSARTPPTSPDAGRALAGGWLIMPEPGSWLQPTRWEYPLRSYDTDSGVRLWVPAGHRCGRGPLPCTSHPASNLRWRRPGRPEDGFVQTGRWRAERWPNPWSNFLPAWRAEARRRTSPGPQPNGSGGRDTR